MNYDNKDKIDDPYKKLDPKGKLVEMYITAR